MRIGCKLLWIVKFQRYLELDIPAAGISIREVMGVRSGDRWTMDRKLLWTVKIQGHLVLIFEPIHAWRYI